MIEIARQCCVKDYVIAVVLITVCFSKKALYPHACFMLTYLEF